jgi:hypothetical protein
MEKFQKFCDHRFEKVFSTDIQCPDKVTREVIICVFCSRCGLSQDKYWFDLAISSVMSHSDIVFGGGHRKDFCPGCSDKEVQ